MIENNAIAVVSVGVEKLDTALGLWRDIFQFSVYDRKTGPDPALSRLWKLEDDRIADQALLYTPGVNKGFLHLIEFNSPLPAIRENAKTSDLCPKNIDVACRGLPDRYEELKSMGHTFRSNWVQYQADDHDVYEVQMIGHDDTNIGFLELIGEAYPFTTSGYAGLSCIVSIVSDVETEENFYKEILSMSSAGRHLMEGPTIEKMIGLPPGGKLDMRLLSDVDNIFGRVELIQYVGLDGENLYPKAKPGALGMFQEIFFTHDIDQFEDHLTSKKVIFDTYDNVSTLFSRGKVIVLKTPAGKRIEIHQRSIKQL